MKTKVISLRVLIMMKNTDGKKVKKKKMNKGIKKQKFEPILFQIKLKLQHTE